MTQQMTVTLPDDLAARVRDRVMSGDYESESAMVEDALRELDDDWDATGNPEFEAFLCREVLASIEEAERDPALLRTIDQVRDSLAPHPRVHERREPYGGGA